MGQFLARARQPPLEGLANRRLRVVAHADDERKSEALAVGTVFLGEERELLVAQPVEPERRLLAGRLRRERAGSRELAREIGMRAQQREFSLLGGRAHDPPHCHSELLD